MTHVWIVYLIVDGTESVQGVYATSWGAEDAKDEIEEYAEAECVRIEEREVRP